MVKHYTRLLMALGLLTVTLAPAHGAIELQATFTGDNVVEALYRDGNVNLWPSPDPPDHYNNWQIADTISCESLSHPLHTLYFRVKQNGSFGSGNPAAFLADITLDGDLVVSTSDSWSWADASTTIDPFSISEWNIVTEYGANHPNADHIWNSVNGGNEVAGISDDAQWIWGGPNFAQQGKPVPEQWLRVDVNAVPEPATTLVWSVLALFGLGFTAWRRRR